MALRIEEEGSDESVGYVEEEGLGVPLGPEVEVGKGWSTVGVSDARGKGETVMGGGLGGDGGIGEGWICDDLCEEVTCLGNKGDVRVRGWRSGLQVWEELRAGAEDGQGVRVAGKKGGAGSGGGVVCIVNEAQSL